MGRREREAADTGLALAKAVSRGATEQAASLARKLLEENEAKRRQREEARKGADAIRSVRRF